MSQLSRPYQIALAGVLLLALAWMVLIRGHHSEETAPPAPAVTHPAPSGERSAAATPSHEASPAKHPTTPAHPRAQGARHQGSAGAGSAARAKAHAGAGPTRTAGAPARSTTSSAHPAKPAAVASRQPLVKAELARGEVVMILFWNPASSVDREVHRELERAGQRLRDVAVHVARAREVAAYGAVTATVTVLQTPTILVVSPKGTVSSINGLTDLFSIEQQVREARR